MNQIREHAVLKEGFRPFFILIPAYLILQLFFWSLVWSGVFSFGFSEYPVVWHIYEMLFGIGSAGVAAFLLTAIPEFIDTARPVSPKTLLHLVYLWGIGRLAFWMVDFLGPHLVAITNLPFLIWITLMVAGPIFTDPFKKHRSILYSLLCLTIIQIIFFLSLTESISLFTPLAILKTAVGFFMILIVVVYRRVATNSINTYLDRIGSDETFLAKPPRYNLAIFSIFLFTLIELFQPDNRILGWIALAAAAALLGVLNDFRLEETTILVKPFVLCMGAIPILMAAGFGLMGMDYLVDAIYGLNHFRHFLTTGAFGLSFLMVMIIVGYVHTGRPVEINPPVGTAICLMVSAGIIRGLIPFYPTFTLEAYTVSSLCIGLTFLIYMILFFPYLRR